MVKRRVKANARAGRTLMFPTQHVDDRLKHGVACHKAGRLQEACAAYADYFGDHPEDAANGHLFVQALMAMGQRTEAMDLLDTILAIAPQAPHLLALKGWLYLRDDRLDDAEAFLCMAAEISGANNTPMADVWLYLGQCSAARGNWHKARQMHVHALHVDATNEVARYGYAMLLLRQGKWSKGWHLYEARWKTPTFLAEHQRHNPGERWTGEQPIDGKTILVHSEQGQGDTLQFLRYLPVLAKMGARVLVEPGREELAPLVRANAERLGVERVVTTGDLMPMTDFHIPLLSLPLALRSFIPRFDGPYLAATPRRGEGAFRVGTCYAGSTGYQADKHRSTRPDQWDGVKAVDGVTWVDLQVGRGGTFTPKDWAETAEVVAGLDLVITVDTAIGHLAGALGVPCWVLIPVSNDWRWGEGGQTTPWYAPSFRLYRQTTRGDYDSVFDRIRADLQQEVSKKLTVPTKDLTPTPY